MRWCWGWLLEVLVFSIRWLDCASTDFAAIFYTRQCDSKNHAISCHSWKLFMFRQTPAPTLLGLPLAETQQYFLEMTILGHATLAMLVIGWSSAVSYFVFPVPPSSVVLVTLLSSRPPIGRNTASMHVCTMYQTSSPTLYLDTEKRSTFVRIQRCPLLMSTNYRVFSVFRVNFPSFVTEMVKEGLEVAWTPPAVRPEAEGRGIRQPMAQRFDHPCISCRY